MTLAAIDMFDQSIRDWGTHFSWPAEYFLRLLVAAFAGGLVGIEREVRGRQAGFRTNLLVCLGSALVMIVSASLAHRPWPHDSSTNVNVDPARIAYGVMTGIGFLCAGTILQQNGNVRGLTTAAAIWCVAAVGLAAGFGMYSLTAFATCLILAALWILDYVEQTLPRTRQRVLVIRRAWEPNCLEQTVQKLVDAGLAVREVSFERTGDLKYVDISLRATFKNQQVYDKLQDELERDDRFELMAAREE